MLAQEKCSTKTAWTTYAYPTGKFSFSKDRNGFIREIFFKNQGNKWIIVCTEYMTRFATTKAIPDAGAMEIAKFIVEEIILRHGAPQQIITDRGTNFMSQIIKEINNLSGISHLKTTAYHPQTNGLTERLNKTLTIMIGRISSRFERLPNVAPVACEEEDLLSLIRRIVHEEIQKPRPTADSLEDMIREEVKINLWPISKRPSIQKYLETLERCNIRVTIKERKVRFNFVVLSECSHPIILGWDLFRATNAIID
ncbi:hypothetical protein LAZ67_11002275 [Cordylochernes scorpioides]|uniref:Integrase catalytic domain-containing protein n=1 Tax=Cordylochernes scorpioides TaxID=51811 RepID=A0ABY6KZV8_9ARAC|nr:hypothetical protein LAZ67_11002275 [Cordylochernes scorpioides]